MTQHRFAPPALLRSLVTAGTLGTALVLSVATSEVPEPQLFATAFLEPVVIAEGEDTVERTVTVTVDEEALAIEGNTTALTITLCALDDNGQQVDDCYITTEAESSLPAGVHAELLLGDSEAPIDEATLRLGGEHQTLLADILDSGLAEEKLTLRFLRHVPPEGEPGGTEGELRFEVFLSATTRFESLDNEDWDQIEGFELTFEGDIVPGPGDEEENVDLPAGEEGAEASDDEAGA
jgi:hypothetical protein